MYVVFTIVTLSRQRVNVPFEMILNGEDPCQLNLHDCPITSRLNANDELRVEITIVGKYMLCKCIPVSKVIQISMFKYKYNLYSIVLMYNSTNTYDFNSEILW